MKGLVVDAVPNLGIDATAARPRRRRGRKTIGRARLTKAIARGRRLARLRYAIGGKATTIYRAGAEKAGTYGAEVWGIADEDILKLRRLAARTLRPQGRGRSLTLTHLLAGAPTAHAEVAPVLQYHRMIWKGVTCRELSRRRGATLGLIGEWWEETRSHAETLTKRAGYGNRGMDDDRVDEGRGGTNRRTGGRGAWKEVRGPMTATHLTLERIGWRFDGPYKIVDDRGHEIPLTTVSPSMVKSSAGQWAEEGPREESGKEMGRQRPPLQGAQGMRGPGAEAAQQEGERPHREGGRRL